MRIVSVPLSSGVEISLERKKIFLLYKSFYVLNYNIYLFVGVFLQSLVELIFTYHYIFLEFRAPLGPP